MGWKRHTSTPGPGIAIKVQIFLFGANALVQIEEVEYKLVL